jgi:2-iminobutanoate/2-iminopropanoate deaminase
MKKIVNTYKAPAPIGPYNQAVWAGPFLYVSGQIPIDPSTGELVNSDISRETQQSMENLKAILAEAGLTFEHVVKSTIFLSDMDLFVPVNEVYGSYFREGTAPARETVAVRHLPKYVNVEISVVAYRP